MLEVRLGGKYSRTSCTFRSKHFNEAFISKRKKTFILQAFEDYNMEGGEVALLEDLLSNQLTNLIITEDSISIIQPNRVNNQHFLLRE